MQVKEAQELNKQVCGNCYNYEYDGFVFVDELGERKMCIRDRSSPDTSTF